MIDFDEPQKFFDQGKHDSAASAALVGIHQMLGIFYCEHVQAREEDEKMGRNGEWVTEWFIEAKPRQPVKVEDETTARKTAIELRHWLGPKANIEIFCVESKRFKREVINDWE